MSWPQIGCDTIYSGIRHLPQNSQIQRKTDLPRNFDKTGAKKNYVLNNLIDLEGIIVIVKGKTC